MPLRPSPSSLSGLQSSTSFGTPRARALPPQRLNQCWMEAEALRAPYCQLVPLILINPSGTAEYPLRFLGYATM